MAFVLHYTDRIVSVFTGDVTSDGRDITQSRNISSADIVGVEIGGRMILRPDISAEFVLNYLRGEEKDATGATMPGDRIPPFNGRISLLWQATDAVIVESFLVFASGQDRLSPRDVSDSRINPDGTPGWATANIRTSWDVSETWQVAASVENVLDERYRVHGSGLDAVGRNVFVSVRARW